MAVGYKVDKNVHIALTQHEHDHHNIQPLICISCLLNVYKGSPL